jgi:hypothetical protein
MPLSGKYAVILSGMRKQELMLAGYCNICFHLLFKEYISQMELGIRESSLLGEAQWSMCGQVTALLPTLLCLLISSVERRSREVQSWKGWGDRPGRVFPELGFECLFP